MVAQRLVRSRPVRSTLAAAWRSVTQVCTTAVIWTTMPETASVVQASPVRPAVHSMNKIE